MSKILIGFNKAPECPNADFEENVANKSLGLLRLAIGNEVKVEVVSGICTYTTKDQSLTTRVIAIFLVFLTLPLTLILAAIGAVSVHQSKSYDAAYCEYKKWNEYMAHARHLADLYA